MSDLLKRADNFNSHSDGISGKNPVDVKLVADLAARVRKLERQINLTIEFVDDGIVGDAAVGWDAQAIANQLRKVVEKKPSKSATELLAGLQPVPSKTVERKTLRTKNQYCNESVNLESLKGYWRFGSTCHVHTSVHWVSDDGQWIVMKHKGHSSWCGGYIGQSYCATEYHLFRAGDRFPGVLEGSRYFVQESRWSKASMEWVEKVMAGWRPDKFVED